MKHFQIEVHQGLEGLAQLREDWELLSRKSPLASFVQDWRWNFAVTKHLLGDGSHFVSVRKNGKIALILPIQARDEDTSGWRWKVLSSPHHKHIPLYEPVVDIRLADADLISAVLRYLRKSKPFSWTYLELSGVCDGTDFKKVLADSPLQVRSQGENAYFHLGDGLLERSLSQKFIRNIHRLERKAVAEQGPVEAHFISCPGEIQFGFETFLEVEASGWKGEEGTGTAIKNHPELVQFYRDLITRFCATDSSQVNLLSIDGQPAAGQLCLRANDRWFVLKIGYSPALKRYGAGNLLMLKFLEHLKTDSRMSELNLVASPVWANRWHLETRGVYRFRYFNRSPCGFLLGMASSARRAMRKVPR